MGLIRAAAGALTGSLADQWKDCFYCDSIPQDVLVTKGRRKTVGFGRHTESNIISNGSKIIVNEGQCMIIVDQGKVREVSAEPGGYEFNSEESPSIFAGDSLASNVKEVFERFAAGGIAARDQRVYYVNIKEIMGNKYGTPNPVPFRVVDRNIGLDMDVGIRCFGEYSYRINNPILFFANVCGNVDEDYTRDRLDGQLRSELLTALQPALAKISGMGIRYSALPGHTFEIANALNDVLSEKWRNLRGIEIVSFGVSGVKASEEDEAAIRELQKTAVFRDPTMAGTQLVGAQADAMRSAAKNSEGAPIGFMGMNMAAQAGGVTAGQLYSMRAQNGNAGGQNGNAGGQNGNAGGQNGNAGGQYTASGQGTAAGAQDGARPQAGWTCPKCGQAGNTGKFCSECGAPKPEEGWLCECGTRNLGKFCVNCGKKRPAGAPIYRCDKCGWQPEDPAHPPKFCPNCGDPFDDDDLAGE